MFSFVSFYFFVDISTKKKKSKNQKKKGNPSISIQQGNISIVKPRPSVTHLQVTRKSIEKRGITMATGHHMIIIVDLIKELDMTVTPQINFSVINVHDVIA